MARQVSFYYLQYAAFLVMLYIFMYNPPLNALPIYPKYFLYPFIIFPVLFNSPNIKRLASFKKIGLLFFLLVLFSYVRELFTYELVFFPSNILLFIETTFLPFFIYYYLKKIKPNGDIIKEIIYVGFFASLISIAMITNEGLANYIRYNLLKTDFYTDIVAHRAFGFAEGLTFSFGTIQGIILSLCIFYSKSNKVYILFIPFLFISIMFNARIGFLPVVIASIIYFILNFSIKRVATIVTILLVTIVAFSGSTLFEKYSDNIEWGLDFFFQASNFLSGSKSDNTLDTLTGDMAVLPQTQIDWLVGSGENIFTRAIRNSDVGYFIQINYGGIVYIGLICLIFAYLIIQNFKVSKQYRWIFAVLVLTFIISNFKGNMFSPIGSVRLLMLLMLVFLYKSNERPKIEIAPV